MSVTICDNARCTGCGLCADVCPCGAVSLEKDEFGFIRPVISGSCVECGDCSAKCPANTPHAGNTEKVFAAYAKDGGIRSHSSSGGLFRVLADKVIERGGAVAAVGYDESFRVTYKIAEDPESLDEMMGSKYTEALSDGIYGKVIKLLREGRCVLFVGTPCRVAALKNFVGDSDSLLTVDFICHGVPSSTLYEKFLAENFGKNINHVSFRDKTRGWQEFSMRVDEAGKEPYINSLYKDPYLRAFLGNAALRDSCYECRFKADHYTADITLGDFWGISSLIPSMNDDKGTSAVVLRTEKGISAFDEIKGSLVFRETSEKALAGANATLLKSPQKPAAREEMLSMLKSGAPFSDIAGKFGKPLPAKTILTERMKRTAKIILGKIKK